MKLKDLLKGLFKRKKQKSQSFEIILDQQYFNNKDILELPTGAKMKVIKVYPFNWWRKILFRLGFSIKSAKVIKVENIYE